jgi:hypothetical protein
MKKCFFHSENEQCLKEMLFTKDISRLDLLTENIKWLDVQKTLKIPQNCFLTGREIFRWRFEHLVQNYGLTNQQIIPLIIFKFSFL